MSVNIAEKVHTPREISAQRSANSPAQYFKVTSSFAEIRMTTSKRSCGDYVLPILKEIRLANGFESLPTRLHLSSPSSTTVSVHTKAEAYLRPA